VSIVALAFAASWGYGLIAGLKPKSVLGAPWPSGGDLSLQVIEKDTALGLAEIPKDSERSLNLSIT